jgi:MFS family permease
MAPSFISGGALQIVGRLGGLQLYSWVFSAFLPTQTATTVAFGKLSDLIGRKTVMLIGIAIFLAGSVLCGLAWSAPSLTAFRLVQGVGAGRGPAGRDDHRRRPLRGARAGKDSRLAGERLGAFGRQFSRRRRPWLPHCRTRSTTANEVFLSALRPNTSPPRTRGAMARSVRPRRRNRMRLSFTSERMA